MPAEYNYTLTSADSKLPAPAYSPSEMRCVLLLAAALIYCPAQAASSTKAPVADSRGPAKDHANGKTGRAKTGQAQGPQILLLDVTINTQKLADVIRVEKLADGRLVLPVEAWLEARLRPAGES